MNIDEWSTFTNVDEIGCEIGMMSVAFFPSLYINLRPWEGYVVSLLWCSISNGFTSMDGPPCTSACGSRTKYSDDPACRRSLQVDLKNNWLVALNQVRNGNARRARKPLKKNFASSRKGWFTKDSGDSSTSTRKAAPVKSKTVLKS